MVRGTISLFKNNSSRMSLSSIEILIITTVLAVIYVTTEHKDIAMFTSIITLTICSITRLKPNIEKELECGVIYSDKVFIITSSNGNITCSTELFYTGCFYEKDNTLYLYSIKIKDKFFGYDNFIIQIEDAREFTNAIKSVDSNFTKLLEG